MASFNQNKFPDIILEAASDNNGTNVSTSTDGARGEFIMYLIIRAELAKMPIQLIKVVTLTLYIVGVAANSLLLCYIIKFKRYRSPTFTLIFSVGCCDLGTCSSGVLLTYAILPTLNGPVWLCFVCSYMATVFYANSIMHMVFFSILRFYQLVFPLSARAKLTVSLVARVCACLWVCNAAISSLVPTYYRATTFTYGDEALTICEFDISLKGRQLAIESMYLLLPNILIAGFHLAKHLIVKRRSKDTISETDHDRKSTDVRAITVVICVFCITSLPQVVHTYLHRVFGYPIQSFHQLLDTICLNMLNGNAALDPFIYVFCASSVQRDIISMVKCKKQKE